MLSGYVDVDLGVSDIFFQVPPDTLVKAGVSLCKTVQEAGQYIIVFPKAFTSFICSGYLVAESVYFARPEWLNKAQEIFKVINVYHVSNPCNVT